MDFNHIKEHTLSNTPNFVIERYLSATSLINKDEIKKICSDLIVLDCETTGISFSKDHLTQIAAARVEDGVIVDWFKTFVNPQIEIPQDIIELTGIKNEDVIDAPSAEEAIEELTKFIGNSKIVAHNAEFDKHFITNVVSGYPLLENLWIDTLDLTRIALPRAKSHRLSDLIQAFGGPKPSHRADDDVIATVHILKVLIALIWQMPKELIVEISGLAVESEWDTACIFKAVLEKKEKNNNVSRETLNLKKLRHDRIWDYFLPINAQNNEDKNEDANKVKLKVPTQEEIEKAFTPDGIIGKSFEDFQVRQEQIDMALAIRENFIKQGNLIVEAGTGVGKSFAYLLTSVLVAKMNNVPIGISTKTNSLLDQLTYKDLPQLSKSFEEGIRFTSLKGISHYPCLRKIEKISKKGGIKKVFGETIINTAPAIATILSFVEQSEIDDLDMIRMDYRSLKTKDVTTTAHECHGKRCPYYKKLCFAHGAREIAQKSEIVLTNHNMLLSDVATSGNVLPNIKHWVIDEAHSFEEEARKTLGSKLTEFDLKTIAERVSSTRESSTCIFFQLEKKFKHQEAKNLFYSIFNKCVRTGDLLAEASVNFAIALRNLDCLDKTPKSSYETEDIWIDDSIRNSEVFTNCEKAAKNFVVEAIKCSLAIGDLIAFLEDFSDLYYYQAELASLNYEIADATSATKRIFDENKSQEFSYFTVARRTKRVPYTLTSEYLDIGKELALKFYSKLETCVFTSATLRIAKSFQYFEEALGLSKGIDIFSDTDVKVDNALSRDNNKNQYPQEVLNRINKPTFELALESSFNFNSNMTVYVASDIAEPGRPGKSDNNEYLDNLKELIFKSIKSLGGSMLILFTSRADMDNCFKVCEPALRSEGLKVVCQRKGTSTKRLADEFIADESVSLFALKSFWEGFDAPGDTLRGVLIAKLPFSIPSDPLNLERRVRQNIDVFRKYCVPKVALEVKQAAGRLIRSATDNGVVILADRRVLKNYGRDILTSMPTEDVRVMPMEEINKSIRNTF